MMLICYYTAVGMMMKSVIDMILYHQLTALITKINGHENQSATLETV